MANTSTGCATRWMPADRWHLPLPKYRVAVLAWPCRTECTVSGLSPCLLAKSSDSGFLCQNTALARLAVLNVLSAARRLVFWQSRAAICAFAVLPPKPAWIKDFRANTSGALINKGLISRVPGEALFTRTSRHPLRRCPKYVGWRAGARKLKSKNRQSLRVDLHPRSFS